MNWETYYFSDSNDVKKFNQTAYKFTGKLTDPVSQKRFQPEKKSPSRINDGRLFYFLNKENALAFDADPEAFVTPVVGLKKM